MVFGFDLRTCSRAARVRGFCEARNMFDLGWNGSKICPFLQNRTALETSWPRSTTSSVTIQECWLGYKIICRRPWCSFGILTHFQRLIYMYTHEHMYTHTHWRSASSFYHSFHPANGAESASTAYFPISAKVKGISRCWRTFCGFVSSGSL